MLVLWLFVAVALLVAEVATTAFFAVFLAAGAFAAAGVTAATGNVLAEVGVFAVVSLVGVLVGRPPLMRVARKRFPMPALSGVGQLVDQIAIVTDVVGDEHHSGHVRLGNESW